MIFHIDLDAFFAAIEERDNPRFRNKPLIVGGPNGITNKGVVSTANYSARAFGIHSGMPLYQAKKLCPFVMILPGNFAAYHTASQQFEQILKNYSPFVEKLSIDEGYVSFYTCTKYYPDLIQVAKRMKKDIKDVIGITATVGIAQYKEIAKIASDRGKPNGLLYIQKGTEHDFLKDLPIQTIPGLGRKSLPKLNNLGIRTISHLAHVNKETLIQLFGVHGLYLHMIAQGKGTTKLTLDWEQKSIGKEITFPKNIHSTTAIEAHLLYLSHRVAHELRQKEKKASLITVKIRNSHFYTITHQKKLPFYTQTAQEIFTYAKALLYEKWRGDRLRLIGISTAGFSTNQEQLLLFDQKNKRVEHIEKALDGIWNKYGFSSVYPATFGMLQTG